MSTRSTTHFLSGDKTEAIIYRHSDGYPEGHGADLQERFFADIEAQTQDHRYNDPTYLAAKLVVWLADQFGTGLDFLSVGVCMEDPSDIEYLYEVHCDVQHGTTGRPVVKCFEVDHSGGWDGPVTKGAEVEIPASAEVQS